MLLRWHASRNEAPLKRVQFQLFFGGIFLGYKLELGVCGRLRNGSYKFKTKTYSFKTEDFFPSIMVRNSE